ncbi:TPA: hypothetical protein NJ227_004372 [Vibrio parahaemolyticus]|uniref:hypothetical protein n=1 Tax=Vibrio parahaemolyticus TaxID=670 RepID=UPI002362524C|nr:hypothetical protein [Vibrio parahaemolyticus]HCG6606972.1 hypothetical protein [Vibrio parahaemolyticus]
MIVKLFCPTCAYEASKNLLHSTSIDVPVPFTKINDSGTYLVECPKGHSNEVILDNIKFELLFEMGANALLDGYYREAVSSFASALERFYEFYWHVAMAHLGQSYESSQKAWKPLAKLSERQVGAYSTAVLLLSGNPAKLLNTNKEVPFRNNVIHNGYIPDEAEATSFGNVVMSIILSGLEVLRTEAYESLDIIYEKFTPQSPPDSDDDTLNGRVNILTCVDVRNPKEGATKIEEHFKRILNDREPTKMTLLTDEAMEEYLAGKG